MGCDGLHCAGCAGGVAVPPVVFFAAFGLAWVAEHIVEVAATSVVCAALAVAAVHWLAVWSDRRDARRVAASPLLHVRAGAPEAVGQTGRRAVGPAVINLNFYGPDGEDLAARVIRAIPGTTGDAITEGK